MIDRLEDAQKLAAKAKNFIILAGAGMSVELGIAPYWTGPGSKYADQTSRFGYTALEHANEELWFKDKTSQLAYFQESWTNLLNIDLIGNDSPYKILLDYLTENKLDYFVRTTNVDTSFSRSGFDEDKIYEEHGVYARSQCLTHPAEHGIFTTTDPRISLTSCPICESEVRPNVLFFDDFHFNPNFMYAQQDNYADFRNDIDPKESLVIEIGAGSTIPNLRNQSSILCGRYDFNVVRINPILDDYTGFASFIPPAEGTEIIELPMKASTGLKALFNLNSSY